MEGLNNLKLNGEMMASLYGRSIVNLNDPVLPAAATETRFKNTVVFFRDGSHAKLPDKQLKFLEQILKACKINIADVNLINLAGKNIDLEHIISNASPEYVLSFGSGTGTELFTMKNNRGTKYLNAPDLTELMQETATSKQLKGKLWAELKAIFNL